MDSKQRWVWLSDALLGSLEKIIFMQQSPVAGYVGRLRRAQPDATPAEIIAVLEKRYVAAMTGTGAAVGAVATVPIFGTVVAFALNSAELVAFLQVTALFSLALAEVHGIRAEEVKRRRTLVFAVVLGDHGAMLTEKMTGQTDKHWTGLLPEAVPVSSVTAVNNTLWRWFVTKYGNKRGIVEVSKVAPFGVGIAVGAGGNLVISHIVVNTSRRVFGPPPASFADGDTMTIFKDAGGASAKLTGVNDRNLESDSEATSRNGRFDGF